MEAHHVVARRQSQKFDLPAVPPDPGRTGSPVPVEPRCPVLLPGKPGRPVPRAGHAADAFTSGCISGLP